MSRSAGRRYGGRRREVEDDQIGFDLESLDVIRSPRRPGHSTLGPPREPEPSEALRARAPAEVDQPLDAVRIARLLGRPAPTPEQVAVIEAPIDSPMLVIAGAGSGKTETMAARVVHLVALGLVRPEQVLGLTFTRKAAAELGDRIRSRLNALARRGAIEPIADPVTVSTYHSYASSLVGDHGLRLGLDVGSRLISEAGAWQIVDDLVESWDGDMSDVEAARTTVVDAVLALAGECAEHLVGVHDIDAVSDRIAAQVLALPLKPGQREPGKPMAEVAKALRRLAGRQQLLPIVTAYLRRKRELEVLDFGDQVALAARIAGEVAEVAPAERDRYRVVLLDEYQDTSHAQLVLLRRLFGEGHPVTAVGDPHQSIYGWRGASAGNLQRFPTDFPAVPAGAPLGAREPSPVRFLATSWRNDQAILTAANQVALPLRRPPSWFKESSSTVTVPPLAARPDAEPGRVLVSWHATVEDEAQTVADEIESAWRAGQSAAVLCRARAQFPMMEAALRGRDLPVEVVGLGGLLHMPEVADLRAALEVVHDAGRGDSLMRLLTGAAQRIGPRDLDALAAWAQQMWRSSAPSSQVGAGASPAGSPSPAELAIHDPVEDLSLVEALDGLPTEDWTGPAGQLISAVGRARLTRLADILRHLRRRTALALPDLVLEVERALLLDVEVAANPVRSPAAARAALDAFVDVAASFASRAGGSGGAQPGAGAGGPAAGAGLGAFLAWLSAAESEERGLEAPLGEVRADAIQILTVHAAKGLEWDMVAIPGLVEGTFPNGRNGYPPGPALTWLGDVGALPFPIRGDAAGLPEWKIGSVGSQRELRDALELFKEDCAEYLLAEERRLAYVALTRARRTLVMTGAVWTDASKPKAPSRFLTEVSELDDVQVGTWHEPEPGIANPREEARQPVQWPTDPLGERRDRVEVAAAAVRRELERVDQASQTPSDDPEGWLREIEVLLAEREAGRRDERQVHLPGHLSASRVVSLARDPQEVALALRRPMPRQPSPQARRGSAFHTWLEQRFRSAALVDIDELPGAADELHVVDDATLARLQRNFLDSAWAQRTPYAVEVSVEVPIRLGQALMPLMVRGRIDAVFRTDSGFSESAFAAVDAAAGAPGGASSSPVLWEVVDWKTGSPPSDAEEQANAAVQLAIYRLAWASLIKVPAEAVSAAFFYAATATTVRPVDLLGADDLARLVADACADGRRQSETIPTRDSERSDHRQQ